MSSIAKRTIFVGPAGQAASAQPLNVEGVAVAAVAPGTVLKQVAGGLDSSDIAATVFGQLFLVADKNQQQSLSVDDAWTINENMVGIQLRSGELANVLCVTAQSLVVGTALSRNGAGLLKIALTDGTEEIVAYSDEVITTSGTELVRVRVA